MTQLDPYPRPLIPPVRLRATYWPTPSAGPPVWVLAGAAVAGVLGALTLLTERIGVQVPVLAAALVAVVWPVAHRRLDAAGWVLSGLAGLLVLPAALLDAGWIVTLALLGAFGLASLALTGSRTFTGATLAAGTLPVAGLRALAWLARGRAVPVRPGHLAVVVRAVVAGLLVLVVFTALFAGADAVFAHAVGVVLPEIDLGTLPARAVLGALVAGFALAAAFTAAAPPRWDLLAVSRRSRSAPEWVVPVVVLDLLAAGFVAIQVGVLFGGRDHVVSTAGLTYAEYARRGFGQLVVATVLTLAVVAFAVTTADRNEPRDRALLRWLLAPMLALTLAIVVSALYRLHLYEQEYGYTRARVFFAGMEVWLGVVLLMVAAAGLRLKGGWLARAVAGSAGAALLVLAALSPDALVARHNVHRWQETGRIDPAYLSGLSADALPALNGLPEPMRSCLLAPYAQRLAEPDPWYAWNRGRARARSVEWGPTSTDDQGLCTGRP